MTADWLVFTDLDGSLLDHDSYDFSAALPAIDRLKTNNIPIIPVSSKTLAELEAYVVELGLNGPVVAENGTVIQLPGEKPLVTPPGYAQIRRQLQDWQAEQNYQFTGFGDMTADQVVEATGLPLNSARNAMQRLASEPLLWQDTREALLDFSSRVKSKGLHLLQGGRFLHLLGDMDKGRAVEHIVDWYRSRGRKQLLTLALGDSGNDADMLLSVDIPVIIRKKDGSHLELPQREDAIVSELPGPAGWNQAINSLLDDYRR